MTAMDYSPSPLLTVTTTVGDSAPLLRNLFSNGYRRVSSMNSVDVIVIVPCYRYGHFLRECVESVLMQSFGNVRVLILDDISPDNTAEVGAELAREDSRVTLVRHHINKGHIATYSEGIDWISGDYMLLLSADHYLLRDYILEKYVNLLDGHPEVGYTFCPGEGVGSGAAIELKGWLSDGQSIHGKRDRIIKGYVLLKELVRGNTIVAASGLVRREC